MKYVYLRCCELGRNAIKANDALGAEGENFLFIDNCKITLDTGYSLVMCGFASDK